jgi:hypothetical protein
MPNGEHNPTDWVKGIAAVAVAIILISICLIALSV